MKTRSHIDLASAAFAVGAVLFAVTPERGLAASDPVACRNRIAQSQLRLVRVGMREIDTCHRRLNAARAVAACNVLNTTDTSAFPRASRRMDILVRLRCPADLGLVRSNFPACTGDGCDNILSVVVPDTRSRLEQNADQLLTPTALGPPFAACQRAIAKARTAIVRSVMRRTLACQRKIDRTRGGFGSLDETCPAEAGRVGARAERRIHRACLGVDPTPLASCTPLPACVTDVSTSLASDLARLAFGSADRCGDGMLDPGEACDDGNDLDTDECTNACLPAVCGDGIVWTDREECDDGNPVPNDGCSNECRLPVCGDGVVAGDEQCDDGNAVPDDGCTGCAIDPVLCGAGGLRALVTYADPSSTATAGGTLRVRYPADVSIPGSGPLRGPVVNVSSAPSGTFLPRDADTDSDGTDDAVEIVFAQATAPWPEGDFARIDFTCTAGTAVLAPDFSCALASASDLFSNAVDPTALVCSVAGLEPIP